MKLSFEYHISCVLLFLVTSAKTSSVGGEEVDKYTYYEDKMDFDNKDIEKWRGDDLEWSMFDEKQREFLKWRDYDQFEWDENLLTWEKLSSDRQRIHMARGWNAQLWDSEDEVLPMRYSTPEAFRPVVFDIDIPALKSLNVESFKEIDVEVRVSDGSNPKPELGKFTGQMSINNFVEAAESGDADFYLHVEDGMKEKDLLQEKVGDVILAMKDSLRNHAGFESLGVWNDEWEILDKGSYDWALFLGAKGTRTNLHYDADVFNFLYVVEGRKRMILIPNDERTVEKFPTTLNEDGGTGHSDLDVLNTNMTLPKHAIEIEIGPGQGIAVPYLCWHAVENLELSLAYSFRIKN